jgi:hypothetical protein
MVTINFQTAELIWDSMKDYSLDLYFGDASFTEAQRMIYQKMLLEPNEIVELCLSELKTLLEVYNALKFRNEAQGFKFGDINTNFLKQLNEWIDEK